LRAAVSARAIGGQGWQSWYLKLVVVVSWKLLEEQQEGGCDVIWHKEQRVWREKSTAGVFVHLLAARI
jgi:hypothetical protein